MAQYISKMGVWEPVNEYAVNPKAQKGKEVYEGPDRDALEQMKEAGLIDKDGNVTGSFGQHYSTDPELVIRSRQLGFKTVNEYLHSMNVDIKKLESDYESKKLIQNEHRDPERNSPTRFSGGGTDTSLNGRDRYGDFKHPDDAPVGYTKPNV